MWSRSDPESAPASQEVPHHRGRIRPAALPVGRVPRGRSPALSRLVVVGFLTGILLLDPGTVFTPAPGSAPPGDVAALSPAVGSRFPTAIRHVLVVFLENAEEGTVLQEGPYERYLAQHYALAGQFYAVRHNSTPDYTAATSGVLTNLTTFNLSVTNVADLLDAAGLTWGAFMQSMQRPCYAGINLTANSSAGTYPYMVAHNPFVYYQDIAAVPSRCDSHDLDFTAWNHDVASNNIPNYAFLSPNRLNDGHDTNVSYADAWLRAWLSPLINGSFFRDSAFIITYDEGVPPDYAPGPNGGGHVYTVVVSPWARNGYTSPALYRTYSLLTTTEWLLGLGRTGHNDNWLTFPPMRDLFDVPPTADSALVPFLGVGGAGAAAAAVIAVSWRRRRKDPGSADHGENAPSPASPSGMSVEAHRRR
jgi:hypothetical protein